MDYLVTTMDRWADPAVRLTGAVLAVYVLIGCICRISMMRAGRNQFVWFLILTLFGVDALGALLDVLRGHFIDWYDLAGVAGMVLMLFATRRDWAHGSPAYTRIIKRRNP